jgi:hypothetical protein
MTYGYGSTTKIIAFDDFHSVVPLGPVPKSMMPAYSPATAVSPCGPIAQRCRDTSA